MSASPNYRFNPMSDRRIGVRQWLSEGEAYKFIRDSQEPDTAATLTYEKKNTGFTWIPPTPEPGEPARPTLTDPGTGVLVGVPPGTMLGFFDVGTTNLNLVPVNGPPSPVEADLGSLRGIPTGTTPGTMTPEEVNLLAPGVEVVDQYIVGEIQVTGTVPRVFRRCLLEGSATPNAVAQDPKNDNAWTVTEVNSASYCINSSNSGTPVELYNCEIRHAGKALNVPGGAIVDTCHIHDCGADGVFANVMWNDITIVDTLIERLGNLRYTQTVGLTTPDIHADGIQIRGMYAGTTLTVLTTEHNGRAANTAGGPSGEGWGSNNAFILVQPGAHTLADVVVRDCWAATDGNWTLRFTSNATFGQIKNFEVTRVEIARTSTSGPMVNHGGSESWSVTDCVDENGGSIDAIMQAGTGWQ